MICPHQDGVSPWPESDDLPRLLVRSVGSHVCEKPLLNESLCSIKEQPRPAATPDRSPPRDIPQVPMKLQIRVSGQRGSLGISIAGGKGSLPYKDQDEGIFISRVTEGGPSEKAGVHVGDRLLEVNGLSMHRATHQHAVSALRKAGSSIRIKVLREQLDTGQQAPEDKAQDWQCDTGQSFSRQEAPEQRSKQLKMDIAHNCLSRKIQAVVCNGNGIVDVNKEESLPEIKKEASTNKLSFPEEKHTMLIPRIILTHPSTSDEDVELLTLSPAREQLYAFDICDRRPLPDCFDGAFYPP